MVLDWSCWLSSSTCCVFTIFSSPGWKWSGLELFGRAVHCYSLFCCCQFYLIYSLLLLLQLNVLSSGLVLLSKLPLQSTRSRKQLLIFISSIFSQSILVCLYVLLILFFALRTRKLKYSNFKDTKKVIVFIATMIVCVGLSFPLYLSLCASHSEHLASFVYCTAILLIATMCLLLLYVPKLPPAISLGQYCQQKAPNLKIYYFC